MSMLASVLIIGLLIFVHELGHLLAAQLVAIPVERFSIGFGPIVWRRHWRGVEYCVSLVPLGGYVMPAIESEEAFLRIAPSRRIVMWLGGPLANMVFAAALLACLYVTRGEISAWRLLVEPWLVVARESGHILAVLPSVFSNPEGMSGLIGIVAAGKSFVGSGWESTLRFAVLLNLNLAVFNLLPVPPLDGGKIICALLERVHPRLAVLHSHLAVVGLALLLLLMVYTTVLDVMRQLA